MRVQFLDRSGYPVERRNGRHVQNFLRLLLHTRRLVLLATCAVMLTACPGTLSNIKPHLSFGSTPVGVILCPAIKAKANMEIANQAICRNPATTALCLAAQVAADQAVMLACGPVTTQAGTAGVGVAGSASTGRRRSTAPEVPVAPEPPEDARVALQRVYESIGMTPMQAARKAMDLDRVLRVQ